MILAMVWSLVGCHDDPSVRGDDATTTGVVCPVWYEDRDQDGFGAEGTGIEDCGTPEGRVASVGDCDDLDAAIHPLAHEVCDPGDRDEDCDGAADDLDAEGAEGRVRLYTDGDDDTFGAGPGWESCEAETPSTSLTADDCDDADAAIHPGAVEICDPLDVDEDCDGSADDLDPQGAEGMARTFPDADGDGFGDAADPGIASCESGSGLAENTDCDDGDALTHPGAEDTCDPDLDRSCDGIIQGCLHLDLSSDAAATFDGASTYAFFGVGVTSFDADDDGLDDAVTGAIFADAGGGTNVGAVFVDTTLASGEAAPITTTASATVAGESIYGTFGHVVAGGDWNGDGCDDLYAAQSDGNPMGFLFLGPLSAGSSLATSDADFTLEGTTAYAAFGDFTGDGIEDLVTGNAASSAVVVVSGDRTGTFAVAEAPVAIGSTADTATYGATFGDLTGDGAVDLLVEGYSWTGKGHGLTVIEGPVDALEASLIDAATGVASTPYALNGSPVGVSDHDGDGYDDALPAGYCPDGTSLCAYVLAGPIAGSTTFSDREIARVESASLSFGAGFVPGGDFDGHGDPDLVIGDPYLDEVGIFLGPIAGTLLAEDADATLYSPLGLGFVGMSFLGDKGSMASVRDRDGDGQDELLLGASAHSSPVSGAGRVYFVLGSQLF